MADLASISEDKQKSQITIKLPNASPGSPEASVRDKIVQKDDTISQAPTRAGDKGANNAQDKDGGVGGGRVSTDRDECVRRIQKFWWRWRDKTMFLLLKHSVRAAEMSLSYDILRKVSPAEAELIKDPAIKARIRFRFAGSEFPPIVVFKIFLINKSNMLSGKNCIKPASEASKDCLRRMGQRNFVNQMLRDAYHFDKKKVWDMNEVVSIKDYWKLQSDLDELPCNMGGRENHWRRLTLSEIPRYTVFYDLLEYLESSHAGVSEHLRENIPRLLTRPSTVAQEIEQANVVSLMKAPPHTPMSPSKMTSARASLLEREKTRNSSRGSKQARERAASMRQMYTRGATEDTLQTTGGRTGGKQNTFVSIEENWEEEAEQLFKWSQELTFEKTMDI